MSAAPTPITPEAAAAFNAANAAFREGHFNAARDAAARAAQLAPDLAIAHVLKARALRRLGDEAAARAAYDAALATDPASFDALLERGNVLRGLGEAAEAAASYSKAMEVRPVDARPALALARLWEEQPGQDAAEQAAVAFQRALDRAGAAAEPALAMAGLCRDMARFRMDRADLPQALDALRQARLLAGSSDLTPVIDLDLAEVYLRLGMTSEAQALMERLSGSEDPALLRALAQLAYRFNFWAEAVAILERWTARHPDDPQAHLDLADMQVKSWLLEEALASLDRAEASGTVPQAGSAALRASVANRLGDADTALSLYEGLVADGNDSFAPNAAMSLLYADSVTPVEVARRHRALFAGWGQDARSRESFEADPDPDRPLRIGMVSADLHHQHPVNIFLQPLLARWDHATLPLTIYATGQTVDDQTRLARSRAGTWHDVATAQLPARVQADGIDILIDLAGHTAGGTMRAFARRMAPVQASFLGYPGSTGVPNIDWLIGDPVVTPPDSDHLCSEQVLRLPNTVFCFAPEVDYPLPNFAAVSRGRPLTFGSFNNIPKLTPRTLRLWVNVLKAVPDSRLLLRAPSFKDAGAVARFHHLFGEQGIPAERLTFRGPVGLDVMMQAYGEVDIALDPFPYCGGTTTLQALWMGVPVLTMQGGQFVSRMGASFMIAAGLPDWIAKDDAAYVAQAAALGQDRQALLDLKRGLRARLLACPGWDADRYAADFGGALRKMWRKTMEHP
jgi:protein O-GlcNAc transferase